MKQFLLFLFFIGSTFFGLSQETCETATEITPGFYTAEAITGTGASTLCAAGGVGATWYSITPEGSGYMTVSSCLGGTDTRLSILTGTCGDLACYAYNDDFCEMTPGGLNYASEVTFSVDSGSTYFIEWDDNWTPDGFDFSVVFTDCLDLITDFSALNYPTSSEINWTGNGNGMFTLEYGETGFIEGEGTIITGALGDQPVTIDGLTPETTYDYYIFEICEGSDTTSTYMNSFTTTPTPPVCGGSFLDLGGVDNPYNANEFTITTICPENEGDVVTVNFTMFDVNTFQDNLEIFNGSSIDSPSLGVYTGQENIGAFESTDSTGCLTFAFTSNGFTQNAGWEADVTCAPPSTCPFPYELTALNPTDDGVTISWTSSGDETMWLYEVVLAGDTATGIGVSIDSNPFDITGLDADTGYDVYISADCEGENSLWIGPASFTTQPAPPECGGIFTDPGGIDGNYGNNENVTYVVCPDTAGHVVTVIFSDINIESCCDDLYVYDGPDASYPLLFNIFGVNPEVPPLTASDTTGCLTFVFTSDGSVTPSGWVASIQCGPPPTCDAPENLIVTNITSEGAEISWAENPDATSWIVEAVIAGEAATGEGISTSDNPYILTGLDDDTAYDVYITTDCGLDGTSFSVPVSFATSILPPACGGTFTDSGGAFGNYSNNENTTTVICPDTAGNVVTVIFSEINIENCCDDLYVYDGPDASYPLIVNIFGVEPDVPPITATDTSGCLTFVFTSDGSVTPSGWIADVVCGPPPTCPPPTQFSIDNITPSSADFSWLQSGDVTSWEVEILPSGDMPTGDGMIVTDNPYMAMDLDADSSYDVYINSWCSEDDESFVLGPYTFTTFPLPPECGGVFVDLGGIAGNYLPNEFTTTTICPDTAGNAVTVNFTMFNVFAFQDTLHVFNGPDINSPPLGSYNGTNVPQQFTSAHESGCLTFLFESGAFGETTGWEADVTCGPSPDCFQPIQLSVENTTESTALIGWVETGNSTDWNVEIVAAGEAPTGTGIAVTENPYLFEGLTDETSYDVYVNSNCDGTPSDWIGPLTFTTNPFPPENDFCAEAAPVNVTVECMLTTGNTFGATGSGIAPGCAFYNGGEVWFSFVAPAGGEATIQTFGNGGLGDSGLALYGGPCDALELISCNDDGGDGLYSMILGTGLTPGATYFAAVWEYGNDNQGSFDICITAPDAGCDQYLGDPIVTFNTEFGGAPVSDINGDCPFNQITDAEVTASELYTVDGFVSGNSYTFSMCDGPGAGSWNPEITVFDDLMNPIALAIGCEVTWDATYTGTYFIGINEVAFCGDASENTEVGNGYPSLTCQGDPSCTDFVGGPWSNFNGVFGGAPVADPITGECPFNQITNFEVVASEVYTTDGFSEGQTYTFSMCEGPNAGSWDPEITLLDSLMNPIVIVQGCTLEWTATYDGVYNIGINEIGFCGTDSENTQNGNGYASLTCEDINVSVNELDNSLNISIFPNPATDKLNITLDDQTANTSIVKLMSIQGKVVLNEQMKLNTGTTQTIDVSTFARGVYLLEVINGDAIATKKIVIE